MKIRKEKKNEIRNNFVLIVIIVDFTFLCYRKCKY